MKIANLPFSQELIDAHNEISLYRTRYSDHYKVTDKDNYNKAMRKLDALVARLRMQYPEYFLPDSYVESYRASLSKEKGLV